MSGTPNLGSAAFKLCIFLATNPDEMLTMEDISLKFGGYITDKRNLHSCIRTAIAQGWVQKNRQVRPFTISAGPTLLSAIGRWER